MAKKLYAFLLSGCHVLLVSLHILLLPGCSGFGNQKPVSREDAVRGQALFERNGCKTCHSVTGKAMYGPPLDGILEKEIAVNRQGSILTVRVNRRYITRSIQDPDYEKVNAFIGRKMPVPAIAPEDISAIVDYIVYLNQTRENSIQADSGR